MPVVDIKGVGKAQFPDDMMTNDIRSFLRQKYSPELSRQDALTPRPATMQASNPSLATRAATAIGEGLNSAGIISDRFGAQQIGKNVTSIGEFLPGIGDATAGDEFGRALKQGDNFGMAMGALGAIPLVGDAAKKSIKEITSKFNPKLIDTNEGFLIKTDNGKLDGVTSGSDFMVKNSLIDKDSRGKGEGVELYVNAIEEARKKGFKRFVSDDDTVDAPAIRIYEALERRGYKVDKHPDFRLVTELEGSDFAHAGDNSAFSIDLRNPSTDKAMSVGESLKSKYPDLSIGVRETGSNIILDKVIVPEKQKGTGTKFMNDLIDNADSKGKPIGLTPSSDFGGNKKRLTEFYKRFGFTENKGKNKDFEISESLIRPANKATK
jgi:GNAT superfamily N-acetyltransferase